jgi:hypothetical protein
MFDDFKRQLIALLFEQLRLRLESPILESEFAYLILEHTDISVE